VRRSRARSGPRVAARRAASTFGVVLLAACTTAGPIATSVAEPSPPAESAPASTSGQPSATSPATEEAGEIPPGLIAYAAGTDPQIYLLDPASGESTQLTNLTARDGEPAGGTMRPAISCGFGVSNIAWSPDGSRMAFSYGACDNVIHLVDLEGAVKRVAEGRLARWAPDGSKIAFAMNGSWMDPAADAAEIALLDVASGEVSPLTSNRPGFGAYDPHWSPDGTRIAYSGPDGGNGVWTAAFIVDVASGEQEKLARRAFAAGWVSDTELVIGSNESTHHVLDIESGDAVDLGPGSAALVAPDGGAIALTHSDPATGAPSVRLVTPGGLEIGTLPGFALAWAPDGSALLVGARDADEPNLAIVDERGNVLATMIGVTPIGHAAAWQPVDR
jgi:dipeptidyl aminopeptidase/acylaminoacyl peptidase